MKDNCDGNMEFKPTRCRFASLSHRGFICAEILGCILVLLATPLLAQTAANTNPCKENDDLKCGILKGCKVASYGVPVGTLFTFTYTDPYGSGTVTIPAGPEPGGYCKISKPLPFNTIVAIKETPLGGYAVSNIEVAPASRIAVPPDPLAGTVSVKIGSGVTEVTYTNHSQKAGYLEICKQSAPGAVPLTGNFTFTVNPGNIGPIVVPVGFCSPPIEVPAGTLTIKETPRPGTKMVSCAAIPASRQGPCNLTAGTSTVTVPAGVISTQTIATITDAPAQGLTAPK
jgi:hypothetical protein